MKKITRIWHGKTKAEHADIYLKYIGGYAGYIQDPDGHLWEPVFNPAWKIEE